MKDKILQTLINQHDQLKKDLESISLIIQGKSAIDTRNILNILNKFEKDLVKHLKLENDTFYVKLIEKMDDHKMDTEKTKEFLEKMDDIKKVIVSFLQKYKSTKAIEANKDLFQEELIEIKNQLLIRVESEEEGVYMYWESLI